jgi:hypothetical protein
MRLTYVLTFSLALSLALCPVVLGSSPIQDHVEATNQLLYDLVLPVIQKATEWSVTVGVGITGLSAFYALVVRLLRSDK